MALTITSFEHAVHKIDGVTTLVTDIWTLDGKGAKRRFTRSRPMKNKSIESLIPLAEQAARVDIDRVSQEHKEYLS